MATNKSETTIVYGAGLGAAFGAAAGAIFEGVSMALAISAGIIAGVVVALIFGKKLVRVFGHPDRNRLN